MALRMACIPSTAAPACSPSLDPQTPFTPFSVRKDLSLKLCAPEWSQSPIKWRDGSLSTFVARAVEQAASTSVGGVVEVTQETFWPILEAAGDKLVVIDLYTQWCGPCKIMYPKIVELSQKYADVLFLKLDCNQENKALAKKLGVKVVPTFKLFRNREEIAEVKGAKFDELVQSIIEARTS
ncbi:hypothetical protein GOP47_0008400 [Adiantum capillus-veneris]|uniref:Thioredoxin domain-containing protein n=1 Tax=Adiantum capillus-veneris TaxID=13818 RepID=A0A9D4UY86_ADICA|nr:hypothetical protein GOP47_0008400 [Adiantum capillus-veneris]